MGRKAIRKDSDYIEKKLEILRGQMDKAEQYLANTPWDVIDDSDRREKEFRFQKSLTDSLMQWSESYINMCGIMEVYNQLEAAKKKKTLRGGQSVSGIQSFVKSAAESKLND